jgi:hypothetical protein
MEGRPPGLTKTKMKLNLNGVEIDLPNNAKVDVSKDGKSVKIELPEAKVVEKIRVIERGASAPIVTERIVERIKVVEQPCTRPHYPTYPTYPWYTYTTSGQTQIVGGITSSPNTIMTTGNITCNNPNLLTGLNQQVLSCSNGGTN